MQEIREGLDQVKQSISPLVVSYLEEGAGLTIHFRSSRFTGEVELASSPDRTARGQPIRTFRAAVSFHVKSMGWAKERVGHMTLMVFGATMLLLWIYPMIVERGASRLVQWLSIIILFCLFLC